MVQSLLQKIPVFKGGTQVQALADSLTVSPRIQRNHQNLAETRYYFKKGFLAPFHLPPCNVVAAAHLSLGKLLGNHRKMMEELWGPFDASYVLRSFLNPAFRPARRCVSEHSL